LAKVGLRKSSLFAGFGSFKCNYISIAVIYIGSYIDSSKFLF